jgi:hypothetical protein
MPYKVSPLATVWVDVLGDVVFLATKLFGLLEAVPLFGADGIGFAVLTLLLGAFDGE